MPSKKEIETDLRNFGQEHLLQFWNELNDEERKILLSDIDSTNLEESVRFFERIQKGDTEDILNSFLEPVPRELHASYNKTSADKLEKYKNIGLKEIADGHVGVLLLAGGQGTRLGVPYPKGMFVVDLPSKKSLFELQAQRILKLQMLAEEKFSKACVIPWYIMTSATTKESTEKFFKEHEYFNLKKENILMFEQGMLPCFNFAGKIILENKCKLAKSPDGNGGLYKALKNNFILEDMDKRNVKYLHAYCVDNILVKVADPVFIGYCVQNKAECGAKVVEKDSPTEPIGVFCKVNNKLRVVEYSEITLEDAERRNKEDNRLTFNAGNICNHFFTNEFLKNVANQYEKEMKLHKAIKKIPYTDDEGKPQKPEKPNGIKIEKFVFDVFPFSSKFVIWEVPRDEEFSALKNSSEATKDSPITAKEAIFKLHRKYIENAGGKFLKDGPCEISPLLSYAGEGLNFCKGKTYIPPFHLLPFEKTQSCENGVH